MILWALLYLEVEQIEIQHFTFFFVEKKALPFKSFALMEWHFSTALTPSRRPGHQTKFDRRGIIC